MKNKSIILLSGGLDSVISLATCKDTHNVELALTFDYGQKAVNREIKAAQKISEYYGIKNEVIKIEWLQKITNTALVNKEQNTPELKNSELDDFEKATESAKNVWVPNRNGLFINIAASYCDSFGYTQILFGANKEEGTTFPDNTQEFIDRINASLEYSTLIRPKVIAPLIEKDKTQIIQTGIECKAPFELIRSCYHENEKHCGKCESCMRYKRALDNANLQNIIKIIFE